jgi:hypothetical protein
MPALRLTPEIINAAIDGYEVQKARIDQQIAELRAMLPGGAAAKAPATPQALPRVRRKLSAAGRKRIAEAQRKRWAESKKQAEPSPEAPKPKRRLSPEGRRRIIEAAKRRWASKRAESEKAARRK